jgi:hypothetical protein
MSTTASDSQASAPRNAQEESKGVLIITPIGLSLLNDTTCPVCREHYSNPPSTISNLDPESDQEWAVSVDHVAEWFGLKRCCGHILGRRCLEKHLNMIGAWRNKCPICRDLWFHEVPPVGAQSSEHPATQTRLRPRTADPPRRSQRIAAQESRSQGFSLPRMSERSGIIREGRHPRPRTRPPRFIQQLLAALEVKDVKDGVKGTRDEIERRLETLYKDL